MKASILFIGKDLAKKLDLKISSNNRVQIKAYRGSIAKIVEKIVNTFLSI